jgi:hypothetical protein
MLTPATALRYERYDRKNQQITQEDAMGLRRERRKVDMKDEYYVRLYLTYWGEGKANSGTEITSERSAELGTTTGWAVTG